MTKWNVLDFLQYKRILRKTWKKAPRIGKKFVTIYPIRKHVKNQLMNEGHWIRRTEVKGLFRVYHIW